MERIFIQPIQAKVAVVFIPFQEALSPQIVGYPLADGVQYIGELFYSGGFVVMKDELS